MGYSDNVRFELTETHSGIKKEPLKRLLILMAGLTHQGSNFLRNIFLIYLRQKQIKYMD